jgi:hypothetical protein
MQEYFKQQADWLKTWQENQESLTKQYAGLSEEWLSNTLGAKKKAPDFFEGWFKSQGDLEEQFRAFSTRMNEMISNVWSSKIPPEVLRYMNISFFEQFYKNWLSSIELPGGVKNPLGMDAGWQQASTFLRSFMEKDNPFFASFGSTKIIDQMSRVFGIMQGVFGSEKTAFSDIMSGYQDHFSKIFESATAQGAEKLAAGFETWSKEMEKNLMAPKLGISREMTHDIAQALVMSKDYLNSFSRMARLVDATSRKAGIRFQSKLSELAINNKPVSKFTDLCALWATENEAVFLDVMGGQEFARLQGDFIDAGHRLKIQWNKLAEKSLEPTPIALKRDLDLAIAEIHQLKRDMRGFRQKMQELQQDAQGVRESQAAAQEELKKAKAVEAAALDEVKKARAAEAGAQDVARKAKTAEAAALDEVKKAKTAEAAALDEVKKARSAGEDSAKQIKPESKPVKTVPRITTKPKSQKND